MSLVHDISELSSQLSSSVVSVGNFDGVHVGHQAILKNLIEAGRAHGAATVVITFDPHPSQVLGYPTPKLLMTPEDRASEILKLGIDHCIIQKFTKKFSDISPKDFLENTLQNHLRMKALVIGPTTHIGRKREGTPDKLKALAGKIGFELQIVETKTALGDIVNSSRIRNEIEMGHIESAAKFLGRNHWNRGKIVQGDGRGKTLGFPTVNLSIPETIQIPGNGVYATRFTSGGKAYWSVTNVGVRPTFKTNGVRGVETHIIDTNPEVVEGEAVIEWVGRLRDEVRFSSAQALVDQIDIDISQAKTHLGNLK